MRRFSQRNPLVTLSDINITPLLDLAFVLLIIFIITTPLLEQGLDLSLPRGGRPDRPLDRNDVRTVEVGKGGMYTLGGRPITLGRLERELVRDYRANPNLIVNIRGDKREIYDHVYAVLELCDRNGITRISLRGEPPRKP